VRRGRAQGNTCLNVLDIARDGSVEVVALDIQDHLKSLSQPVLTVSR